jgi:hypothetical protein
MVSEVSWRWGFILSRSMCDYSQGFGLVIRFIDHLHRRIVSKRNYSATANLHALQVTTAPVKSFPVCCVFSSLSLVTASNSGDSSTSGLTSFLNGGSLPTTVTDPFLQTRVQNWLGCPNCLPYNSSARTTVESPVSTSTAIVARRLVATETCLLAIVTSNGSGIPAYLAVVA